MTDTGDSKRGPGKNLPPLDVTAPLSWTRPQRVQFCVQMLGGPRVVAPLLGVSERTVARYQTGESAIPPDVAELLCQLAGLRPGYIAEGGHFAASGPQDLQVTLRLPVAAMVAVVRAMADQMTPELRRVIGQVLLDGGAPPAAEKPPE